MNIKLQLPKLTHLRPRITVVGVGGAGSNAVNNMIASGLSGVTFVVANTDAQSLANSSAESRIQLGATLTEGLGAGARPEIGRAAAEETIEEIRAQVAGSHMVFVAAGMGGGTGTGAAAVIARVARECGALTVGVVTKPFHFEGTKRMRAAEAGIALLKPEVDTLIVIPNQNLFRIANERTTFADAFVLADQVLYSGISCVVDLIVKEGLINLDFADVRTVMSGMGTAMMGTGEASGEKRAVIAAEEAISNPLLDDISLRGARGLLVSITGNRDLTLYEVDEAATRVRQEVDGEANIIVGATFDDTLGDRVRVSIVASGMERIGAMEPASTSAPMQVQGQGIGPATMDTQPPFIEPYPSVFQTMPEPERVPQQGYLHAAEQPPDQLSQLPERPHATEAHPPHPQTYYSSDVLTRALSEALTDRPPPAHANEVQSQLAPPHQTWTSPTGAVFNEGPPAFEQRPSPRIPAVASDAPTSAPQSFAPQPPADTRRLARRMPQVDEFPSVGQREYHAKMAQYAEPHPQPPRAYTQPAAEPPRKLSFFERLTGARRKSNDSSRQQTYQQAPKRDLASRDIALQHAPNNDGQRSASSNGVRDEQHDLPAFFGADRK